MKVWIGCLLVLLTLACDDNDRTTFVSGYLYNDCSQSPRANTEVIFKATTFAGSSDARVLATAVTDGEGKFSMSYELGENASGAAELDYYDGARFQSFSTSHQLNRDYESNFYLTNISDLIIELSGSRVWSPTDTLFYAATGFTNYSIVQPSTGIIDTLFQNVGQQFCTPVQVTVYWGLGSTDFQLAQNALSDPDSDYNHVEVYLAGCDDADTVNIVIN